ncbi:protein of unknown function [Taphrina deformans PYCC 5710]|uniref:Karyogamy protein n=1 Tax=Taphrina deformans (strain PYCC 5710 / ATCC 11124 / CBS 356.35 / IMI 108563 / JCM 9778 / NBRC 8474) TaxID=1097556 RepID=R4XHN4_TAPDE|nr:protein of unknown function [Taphrina deformans PYCC 5710]|eukprot:CCG84033.1 protein of unknown function [Taphrina deformans PYCC 5710]
MNPPITPPLASSVTSSRPTTENQLRSACSEPRTLDRSALALSCGPLQQQITKLDTFASTVIDQNDSDEAATSHLWSMRDKYAEFSEIALFVLTELDSEGDIEYAVGNRDIVWRVQGYLQNVDHNMKHLLKFGSDIAGDELVRTIEKTHNSNLSETWRKVEQLSRVLTLHASTSSDWIDCQRSLDAVQMEEKDIAAMIFMMEEQRHTALQVPCVELDVLTTILEDLPEGENTGTPGKKVRDDGLSQWERTLSETVMKLTSKLSPLRASISMFAPRLESFAARAQEQFPSAVIALRTRYAQLSTGFQSLTDDFKRLKDELNEDKWLAVFRQVNKQATEMMNSLQRTFKSLEATPFHSIEAARLMSNFDLKTEHYGNAIPAVMSVMHRGVQDRLTLNGEILRGYDLLMIRWKQMKLDIADMNRRIQGARSAGIVHTVGRNLQKTKTTGDQLRPLSQTEQNSAQISSREGAHWIPAIESVKKSATRLSLFTPQRKRQPTRVSLESSSVASPAVFRKDISMDPPRSRSRLGYVSDVKSPLVHSARPPWNAGTSVRVIEQQSGLSPGDSPGLKSRRSTSRLSNGRSGAILSLEVKRPHTPNLAGERRSTTSFLPLKSPHKTATTHKIPTLIPQLPPPTPSKETIQRLSRPKLPPLGVAPNRATFVPTTPSKLRSGLISSNTPTSIPVARRMVSNPEGSSPTKLRSGSALSMRPHGRPASALSDRRQSNIPLPTPQKLSSTWKH